MEPTDEVANHLPLDGVAVPVKSRNASLNSMAESNDSDGPPGEGGDAR